MYGYAPSAQSNALRITTRTAVFMAVPIVHRFLSLCMSNEAVTIRWAIMVSKHTIYAFMAVASGPASPVLAGPVFEIVFKVAHAQNSNKVRQSKNNDHACTSKCLLATSCAALKLAAMLIYQQCFTSLVDSNHLTVHRCMEPEWSLTTPPKGRSRASSIVVWHSARGWLR